MAGGLRPARVRLTVTTAAGRAGIRRQAFSQPPDARPDGVPPRPDAIQEPARPSGVPPRSAGPAPGRGRERCEYGVHGIALLSSGGPARHRWRPGGGWDTGPVTPEDLAHLRRARDLMDREYANPLDVPAMARQALMSPSHFARQFRAAYGETPYSYLMTRRIERAMALLRRGDLSVTDVCMQVGCTSLGSFSARFTEIVR